MTSTNAILKTCVIKACKQETEILPKRLYPAQTLSARCPVQGLTDWRRNTWKKKKSFKNSLKRGERKNLSNAGGDVCKGRSGPHGKSKHT